MVAYKVIDGFADAYEAEFQRDGRLYLTGKSNAFRTVLSVGVFLGCLNATHNLVGSCLAAVLAQLAGVCLFDFSVIGHLPQVDWEVRSGRVGLLFKENVVLFLSVILDFYIFSAAKYAIEGNMADKYQAVFGAIFMPTSVINLVAGFVIRPYITKLSDQVGAECAPGICRDDRPAGGNHRGAYGAGSRGCLDSRNSGSLNLISENCVHAAGMPSGAGVYHSRRRVQCVCESVLLCTHHYAGAETYFSGLRRCDGSGAPYFFALRTRGRTAGRIAFVSAFDGGTDCLLWTDVACDVPETGTWDIELV